MKHKLYVILGANSEVGMAYIRGLEQKQEKCKIIAHYYESTEEWGKLLANCCYVKVIPVQGDLSIESQTDEFLAKIREQGIPTHILHCAAPPLSYKKIKELDWNHITKSMNIQVGAIVKVCKAFLPAMGKQHYGKVVIMLSSCTLGIPPKYMTEYTMVKYALLGFMKSAACEYAAKGICINGISPSMMKTKFLKEIDERMVELLEEQHPQKRLLTVEELIKKIEFLMSHDSDFMTGINLNVSGGQMTD